MPLTMTQVKFDPETMKVLRSIKDSLEKLANSKYMSEDEGEIVIDERLSEKIKHIAAKSAEDKLDDAFNSMRGA